MIKDKDKFKRAVAILSITSFIIVLIGLIVYSKMKVGIGPICPFKYSLDLDCPGCGATRMAESLIDLDIYQAFRYNPFIFITAPIVAVVYMIQSYQFVKNNKIIDWLDKFLISYAILLVAFGIIRNIPIFSFLKPTNI